MRASAGTPPDDAAQVVVIIADGARPDALADAIGSGKLSALASLRDEGGLHTVTSTFPTVTGPAYAPFLLGRFPGDVGLPGLRWYDRSRQAARMLGHARSYVGAEMGLIDNDLDPAAPTIFELARPSIGALSVIRRGLPKENRIGRGARFIFRTALTHFRGNVRGWLQIDEMISDEVVRRIRNERPRYTLAALTGIDKTSHAEGHESSLAAEALSIVDTTVARIRADAERDGRWEKMQLWITSDHGHSPVHFHEDLARLVESPSRRVLSHPWAMRAKAEVAVMVSGNAMAHIYVELERGEKPGWTALAGRWHDLLLQLEGRDSVDLVLLPRASGECEVRASTRGTAMVSVSGGKYSYSHRTGNPLGVAEFEGLSLDDAHAATLASDYPDGVVQIAHLAASPRSGDIILSAARDWDFRARYEPIPHVSSHGALHREHMLVPLLINRPATRTPLRTIDTMPSALTALGIAIPSEVRGRSFV
ncbi:MAG: alkaline phosphatase family protein [Gemmatimonadota bacterium]|nr:alkaline phosphatase family protein [Gemmatimonadota bacterium]